ncbi:CLUMA_CG002513, isoform B [Clunio marinus]|uniref:CLUMA_CG002513, isoform B n=1 Tax=Clunio marinus TaxID=568069 RepID=A0A1J1HLQ1_9DIPT|nr:CLUMA_CG002513, isoform B [Clunio marinus]
MDVFPTKDSLTVTESFEFIIPFAYYDTNECLEEEHRGKLSRYIIHSVLGKNHERKLNKDDFKHLSSILVELFPTEVESTYFVPSTRGCVPTGKLYSSYLNLRNSLVKVGLIGREARRVGHVLEQNDSSMDIFGPTIDTDAMEIIEGNDFNDKNAIESAWKRTYDIREEILKTEICTIDYVNKYPYLRTPAGYELFLIDAYERAPEIRELNLHYSISKICSKIIRKAKQIRNEATASDILKQYENGLFISDMYAAQMKNIA